MPVSTLTLPRRSRLLFYAAVFCCFSPIGLLSNARTLMSATPAALAALACYSGGMAVAYAWTALNRLRWFPATFLIHMVAAWAVSRLVPPGPGVEGLTADALAGLQTQITTMNAIVIGLMALAYAFFFALVSREAKQRGTAETEIRLARNIHRALVPVVEGEGHGLTWRGISRPSGEVGGDLVDVIPRADGWWGVIADVAGHGVAAGVTMGMFKTALHGHLEAGVTPDALLSRINRTLVPLSDSTTLITAAVIRQCAPRVFECVLAGHPPLLLLRATDRVAIPIGTSQMALGLASDVRFTRDVFTMDAGDVLVMITDGLLEVFDRRDREFGIDGVRHAALATAGAPLTEIESRIFAACRAHGPQADDQSVLLVRAGGPDDVPMIQFEPSADQADR